jgi:hypothetical protein
MFRPIRSIKRSLVPVATLVLGLALVLPTSAFAADQVFKVTGKGWGHGIGMSQYGARGYARHGFTYDNILKHYYTGTTLGTLGSEPTVKVAIATSGGTKCSTARLRIWTAGSSTTTSISRTTSKA